MEGRPQSAPFREFRQPYFGSLHKDNSTFGVKAFTLIFVKTAFAETPGTL
jgi:hypothetical protein